MGVYWGYIGIMQKTMETTTKCREPLGPEGSSECRVYGVGFRHYTLQRGSLEIGGYIGFNRGYLVGQSTRVYT